MSGIFGHSMFSVHVQIDSTSSMKSYGYRSKEEAFRAANGYRSTLQPKGGGSVSVVDPDGRELQSWIEHPLGPYFTQPGGFKA